MMSSRCANSINQLLIIIKRQWMETSIHSRFLRQIVFIEILVNFVIYLERNYCSSQNQSVPTITELKFSLVIILEDAELCPDLKFTCDDAVYVVFLRYKAVIDACSLQPDIDLLPFGDQTEIGERVYTCFIYYLIHTSDYLSLFG